MKLAQTTSPPRKAIRGMTMLIVLGVMAILMVIGMGMLSTSGKSMLSSSDARGELKARVASEAVISAAVADAVNRAGEVFGGSLSNGDRTLNLGSDVGKAEITYYTTSGGSTLQQGLVPAGPLKGLMGYKYGCSIDGTGKTAGGTKRVINAEVVLYQVPIFQFGVFYDSSLEITPGPTMRVFGRVHTNDSMYLRGTADLHFTGPLTAAGMIGQWWAGSSGSIGYQRTPADPTEFHPSLSSNITAMTTSNAPPLVNGVRNVRWGQAKLHLALGGNAMNPHAILDPAKPSDAQALRRQNYDWIAQSKSSTSARFIAGVSTQPAWIRNPRVFWDHREQHWVKVWDFDMRALRASANRDSIFYFADTVFEWDKRASRDTLIKALRIINADTLGRNLTIATPNPLYVKGNFNTGRAVQSDSTSYYNAQLASDVFTLLSPIWSAWDSSRVNPTALIGGNSFTSCEQNYANSTWGCSYPTGATGRLGDSTRIAICTVRVNAAVLAGNKQSERTYLRSNTADGTYNSNYEGGWHNTIRFLENWGNKTVVFKGSFVCLWQGQAPGLIKSPSIHVIQRSPGYYSPPARMWGFDDRFLQLSKMPPGAPFLATAIFTNWLEH
jgi:hypothetical protein